MSVAIFDGTTNDTAYLKQRSVKISDQMGNRKNTASFSLLQGSIDQGRPVRIYEVLDLRQSSSSGTAVLYPDSTSQATGKWLAGDQVIVDIQGTEKKYTILSVDHSAVTITLTANLTTTVTKGTHVVGRLLFGGVCISNPDEEIGVTGTFEKDIRCADWTYLYDRKVIVQQFEDMFAREIIGRMVYFFCPTDSQADIDDFESAWTASGTANAMADDTADRLHKTKSQKTSTTGSGTAIWTKSGITSTDISAHKHARFWWKPSAGEGIKITSLKLRLGTDASNYFEWDIDNIGSAFDDCWNYESVELANYDTSAGSPNLAAIQWAQIRVTTTAAITANSLRFDYLFASTGSFTLQNTARGTIKFNDVRIQYRKASDVTEEIAKQSGMFWYIDYERDIHLFTSTTTAAPWAITDTSENYWDLAVEVDISKLKNRQIVRGGEAPSTSLYTQTIVADGSQTSFLLDYKPKTLTMTVAGGGQTLGVEGFVDETTVQWVYNFSEKVVRKTSAGSTPTNGQAVVFTYYPYQPIRVSVTSPTSIATMKALTGGDGIYDGVVINDASISDFNDARMLARAELTQWANAIVNVKFKTEYDGLRAGQTITVTDSSRSISAQGYLIQSVHWAQKHGDRWQYNVTASSTLFGLIEFIQMLLKRTNKVDISPTELVDSLLNQDETITLTDVVTPTARDKTVYAALKKTQWIDFIAPTGSKSSSGTIDTGLQWYAEFIGSETGTAQFTTSNHNNNAELRITTAVGGNGKELQVRTVNRLAAVPSTSYTIDAWTEIQTALSGLGTGGGFQMVVKEWSAQTGGSALATNTIFSAVTAVHDFTKRSATFTTNASTAWISIEISMYRAIGTGRIADVTITPATTETATLAAQASFGQAT